MPFRYSFALFALHFTSVVVAISQYSQAKRIQENAQQRWPLEICVFFCVFFTGAIICLTVYSVYATAGSRPVSSFLGFFALSFCGFAIFTAISAANALSKVAGQETSTLTTTTKKRKQIMVSAVLAVCLTCVFVGVSLWRGRHQLSAAQFFGYLVVRHLVEVAMAFLCFYAIAIPKAVFTTSFRRVRIAESYSSRSK
eukprot:c7583_g1_i3.p1 GENE.c7583_g1_i3~~c7583_g1_i3.p1  ORF type:complete len:197 (-),score=16.29 c7583_g1_i3:9-599(-)